MAKTNASNSILVWPVWLLFLALPLLKIESLQDSTLLSRYLVLSVIGTGLLLMDRNIFKASFPRLISILLILFAFLSLASIAWAYNPSEAWATSAKLLSFIPLFFIFYYLLKSGKLSLENLLKACLIFAIGAALPALFQLLKAMGSGAFFDDIYVIKGNFSHKNLLASALMLCFPFVLAAWSLQKGAWSRVAMTLAILMIIEMFVLRTRGVWLGLFSAALISGLVFQFVKPSSFKISRFWASALAGGAVLILLALFLSPQIKAGFTNSSNVQKRLAFWDNSWEMIQEHPLTGVGGGNWKLIFPKYGLEGVDTSVMQGQTHIQRPHNDYLWTWAEFGALGLLIYLALIGFTLWQLFRNFKQSDSKQDQVLNLAALFSLVAFAVFSFGDFPLERAPHTFFLMLIIAVAFYKTEGPTLAKASWLAPLFLIFGLAVNGIRYSHEQEAKTLIEIDYSGATLGQRMGNRNQQAITRERNRISAELSAQSNLVYDETFFTVDNYAMPVKYFDAKGKLFGGQTVMPEVKAALDQAFKDAPFNILNYQMLAEYYDRNGRADSALYYADQALAIAPAFKAMIMKKADLILRENNYLDALAVLNLFPYQSNDPRYLDMLSQCLVKSIQAYPAEHQRFAPMMQYFQQYSIDSREKMIALYRQYRQQKAPQNSKF